MFRDDDIIDVLKLVDFKISKSELGAFFRKDDHPNYMECGDQVLRNFLNGLVIYLRGTKENPKTPGEVLSKKVIKPAAKVNHTKRPDFKTQQERRVNKDITNVKYKNKKKS